MGKISLTVEGSEVGNVIDGNGIVIAKNVSSEDSMRLVTAYAYAYRDQFVDEDGNPRQPSVQEVIEAWFNGIIQGSIDNVERIERELKAAEAANSVTKITVE